jgi:hypothetical protein
MKARRYIHGVFLECGARHDFQRRFVGRGQDDKARGTVPVSAHPVDGRHTPAVARDQPGKMVRGYGGDQVVADLALVLEEFGGNHATNCVRAEIFHSAGTTAVPVKPGHRLGAARLQFPPEDVTLRHGPQYPAAGTPRPMSCRSQPAWPNRYFDGPGSGADELGLPRAALQERTHPDFGVAGGERPGEKLALQRQPVHQR